MIEAEKQYLQIKQLAHKMQQKYDKYYNSTKQILNNVNKINEEMCLLHLSTKDNFWRLVDLQMQKYKIVSKLEDINLKLHVNDDNFFKKTENAKVIIKKGLLELKNIFKVYNAHKCVNELQINIFDRFEKAACEILLCYAAINKVNESTVKKNRTLKNNLGKFVFAKDIINILNLLNKEKFETALNQEQINSLSERIGNVKEDIPIPVPEREYEYLQNLYYEAANEKLDIPIGRSESPTRILFGVRHKEISCTVFPELADDYTLEY